jgi:hypothetical protein
MRMEKNGEAMKIEIEKEARIQYRGLKKKKRCGGTKSHLW